METPGWDSLWVALGLLALGLFLAVAFHSFIELRQHRKPGGPRRFFGRALPASSNDDASLFEPNPSDEEPEAPVAPSAPALDQRAEASPLKGPTPFELAIEFECLGRMPETTLEELRTVRRIGSKPVRCMEGPGFHQACLSIALAGRSGFLNLLELDEFSARCEELAGSLELTITSPPLDASEVIRLARQAEQRLLEMDAQVQFSLVTDRPPSLSAIEQAAQYAGLSAWGEGRFFMQEQGSDDVVFSVLPGDEGALLGFMMDLPRVQEPAEAWSAMVEVAKVFQQSLGGQLVDERNAVLDDMAFGYIAQQIQDRTRVFVEAGLVPGEDFTKRIFT